MLDSRTKGQGIMVQIIRKHEMEKRPSQTGYLRPHFFPPRAVKRGIHKSEIERHRRYGHL